MGKISGVDYPDEETNPGMIRYHPTWACRSLLELWSTVIPLVFMAPDTYIHLLGHVAWVAYQIYNRDDAGDWSTSNWKPPSLPWDAVRLPSALLAIFIVFFTGNTFIRFNALYADCMDIRSHVVEIAGLCKLHVADTCVQWDVVRLLLASMVVHYYTMDGKGIEEDEWEDLKQQDFLTHNEMQRIKDCDGPKFWLLQCTALRHLKTQMMAENGHGALAREYDDMEQLVLQARRACGSMARTIANPIPFPYYHTLLLLIWFNYALISYALSEFHTPLTVGAYALIIIVITGMREAGASMANPFGTDVFDFPMQIFIKTTVKASKAILLEELPDAGDNVSHLVIASSEVEPLATKAMRRSSKER